MKILVVDDSEFIRNQLLQSLQRQGYDVLAVKDGLEGLKRLEDNPDISLIITDINMPVMDGLSLASAVRQNSIFAGIKIMILSSESSAELKIKGVQAGAQAWVTKPYDIIKLLAAVDKLVQK